MTEIELIRATLGEMTKRLRALEEAAAARLELSDAARFASVCEDCAITTEAVRQRRAPKEIRDKRAAAIKLLRNRYGWDVTRIARIMRMSRMQIHRHMLH